MQMLYVLAPNNLMQSVCVTLNSLALHLMDQYLIFKTLLSPDIASIISAHRNLLIVVSSLASQPTSHVAVLTCLCNYTYFI